MPTDTLPKGRTIVALSKDESAFATLPSGNWTQTRIYGATVGEKQGFDDDPILGAGLVNTVDTSQPAPALPEAGGNINVPLDLDSLGIWLKRLFGAPSTSGSTPDYVHAFASGSEVLPTFAQEIKKGSSLYYVTLGLAANRFTVNASRKAGYDRMTIECIACKESKFTSTQGGTPAALTARVPLPASLPVFKVNGTVAGQVMEINATYDNKLSGQDFLSGDPHIAGIERDGEATFSGSMRIRWKDATYHDLAIAGTAFAGELLWQLTSARLLSLAAPIQRLERTPIEVNGPGGMEAVYSFRSEADASNAMLTATLKSPTATF